MGFYRPGFLRIHVNTDRTLTDLSSLNDPNLEATYLHEYVHFIQDISTIYGLNRIHVISEYMKDAVLQIRTQKDEEFLVPVEPKTAAQDNVDTNLNFLRISTGDGRSEWARVSSASIKSELVKSTQGDHLVEKVMVDFEGVGGIPSQFNFGGLCISESMAFELERICYPHSPSAPDLPYTSARQLATLLCPSIVTDPKNLIALCDAALMCTNPGVAFYKTLELIQYENIRVINYREMYEHCLRDMDVLANLDLLANNAKARLAEYFTTDDLNPLILWLNRLIDGAVQCRKRNLMFPIDIASGGPIATNAPLIDLMNHAGSPLVTNSKDEITVMDPQLDGPVPDQLLMIVIGDIHRLIRGTRRSCSLEGSCKLASISTDHRCTVEPWSRASDKELCPFARVWYSWDLSGKYPKA